MRYVLYDIEREAREICIQNRFSWISCALAGINQRREVHVRHRLDPNETCEMMGFFWHQINHNRHNTNGTDDKDRPTNETINI